MVSAHSARTEVQGRADENYSLKSMEWTKINPIVPTIRAVATWNQDLELSLQSSAEDPPGF